MAFVGILMRIEQAPDGIFGPGVILSSRAFAEHLSTKHLTSLPYQQLVTADLMQQELESSGWGKVTIHRSKELQTRFERTMRPGFTIISASM